MVLVAGCLVAETAQVVVLAVEAADCPVEEVGQVVVVG